MKKLSMICMAALLVMAMSCKKNENENNADGKGFRASMEAQTGDSKTHLEGSSVKWDYGDAIWVVNGVMPAVCKKFTTNADVDQDGCVEFRPSQDVDRSFFQPSYTAYYPAGIYNHDYVTSKGKVTLPDTQTYVKVNEDDSSYDSFGNGCNPMAAKSYDTKLHFKHLCGILALPLKGTCMVKSIKLTAKGGEQLCGVGEVVFSGDQPTFAFDVTSKTDGNNSITLTCGDGVQLNTTNATTFYFVIPAVSLSSGIDVKLTDTDNNVWERSASMVTSISQHKISTMAELSIETHNPNFPIGAIPGWFTVDLNGTPNNTADDKKVCFSRGNLQYTTTGSHSVAGGGTATGTWRFAEHQYDFVGAQELYDQPNKKVGNVYENGVQCDNRLISPTYSGWIDLFGWGTSGFNDKYPYMTSTNNSNYGDGNKNISGTDYDWGVYNAISNGGNTPNTWRTLSTVLAWHEGEWACIIFNRNNASNLRSYGRITNRDPETDYDIEKDIAGGLILLPDDWVKPADVDFVVGSNDDGNFKRNSYTPEQWAKMEAAGAVFLPYTGYRSGENVWMEGSNYWTSTCPSASNALYFSYQTYGSINTYNNTNRYTGFSVRLVQDKK